MWKPVRSAPVAFATRWRIQASSPACHGAAGVLNDQDPGHPQQVHAQDQAAQGVFGDVAAGGAQDLGFAKDQSDHLQWLEAGVHAGDDADSGVSDAVEVGGRRDGVAAIGCEEVGEAFSVHGDEPSNPLTYVMQFVNNQSHGASSRPRGGTKVSDSRLNRPAVHGLRRMLPPRSGLRWRASRGGQEALASRLQS